MYLKNNSIFNLLFEFDLVKSCQLKKRVENGKKTLATHFIKTFATKPFMVSFICAFLI